MDVALISIAVVAAMLMLWKANSTDPKTMEAFEHDIRIPPEASEIAAQNETSPPNPELKEREMDEISAVHWKGNHLGES